MVPFRGARCKKSLFPRQRGVGRVLCARDLMANAHGPRGESGPTTLGPGRGFVQSRAARCKLCGAGVSRRSVGNRRGRWSGEGVGKADEKERKQKPPSLERGAGGQGLASTTTRPGRSWIKEEWRRLGGLGGAVPRRQSPWGAGVDGRGGGGAAWAACGWMAPSSFPSFLVAADCDCAVIIRGVDVGANSGLGCRGGGVRAGIRRTASK